MTRKTQFLIAGAGAIAGMVAARAFGGKHIHTLPYGYGMKLKKAVTINNSPERLYDSWRDLRSITTLSDNIHVEVLDDTHSHWTVRVPGGLTTLQWTAEITVDRPGEMIGWRSLDGADIDNAGYVRFEQVRGG